MTRTKERLIAIEEMQQVLGLSLEVIKEELKGLRDGKSPKFCSPLLAGLLGGPTPSIPMELRAPCYTLSEGVMGFNDLRSLVEHLVDKIGYKIKYKYATPTGWELVEKPPQIDTASEAAAGVTKSRKLVGKRP